MNWWTTEGVHKRQWDRPGFSAHDKFGAGGDYDLKAVENVGHGWI